MRQIRPDDVLGFDSRDVVDALGNAYQLNGGDEQKTVVDGIVVPSSDPLQAGHGIAQMTLYSETVTVATATFERVIPPDMEARSGVVCRILDVSWRVDYSNGNDVWRVDTVLHRGTSTMPLSQHQAQEDRRYTTSPDGDEYFPDRTLRQRLIYDRDELRFDVTNDATDVPISFELDIRYVTVPPRVQLPR